MATLFPPPSKRQRREGLERSQIQQSVGEQLPQDIGSFKARFIDGDGKQMTDVIEIPLASATEKNVSLLLNTLLERDREDFTPYRFRVHIPGKDIVIDQYPTDLLPLLQANGVANPFETTITLSAEPQAVFKVNAVSRLAAKIPGHGQPILCASFSPADSNFLATGSGDNTSRIWDTGTGTPKHILKGHTGWVLGCQWRQDGSLLATCSMDGSVRLWDPKTGKPHGKELKGHGKPVLMLSWQPYHLTGSVGPRLASASKDGTIRTWIANSGITDVVCSGHKGSVTCVKWGAGGDGDMGLIYSASHDKSVRVWNPKTGSLVHNMTSHAHWVNHLALSTDAVLRTAYFDHTKDIPETEEGKRAKAKERFDKVARVQGKIIERLVSASDDFTVFLWDPVNSGTKPVARLGGHQKQVNHVSFSPDSTMIASTGWDNGVKLWDGRDGKYLRTLRGHVSAVYQSSFSADGRLLVTASKDSTAKVWNVRSGKLVNDLVGHQDEVFAIDWSPDGAMVASGGKDKAVMTWRN